MTDMLRALHEVAETGELDNFFQGGGVHGSARARTAFRAVYIERNSSRADRTLLDELNQMLSSLPMTDQVAVVAVPSRAVSTFPGPGDRTRDGT